MNRVSGTLLAFITAGALGASTSALADNPLGLYIGAGVGASNIGNNNYAYNYGYNGGYNNNLAWKAILGVRPIPVVGAEFEYIDFGSNDGNSGYYGTNYYYGPNAHPKASVLYAMGYLPLPLPFLDVYGKLGAAHLQTDITSFSGCPGYGPLSGCTPVGFRFDQSNNKFAYGVGVQWKFQDFAFRAEYEGISSTYGNPEAVTASVTWTF
ncbi:MAG: outer membrane beta-barrel protein [Steroidobacteraceae bacterium]